MTPVTVIGNVNADLVMGPLLPWPVPGTEVVLPDGGLRVGGAAGNTALALAGLGHPHRLVASRGGDVLGRWLAEKFGAAAAGWSVSDGPTTISVGITHPDGERTFFTAPGHLDGFCLDDVLAQLPATAAPGEIALLIGAFVSPRLLERHDELIDVLAARGFAVALDTGWPTDGWTAATRATVQSWLARTTHLLLNEAEAMALSGAVSPAAAAAAALRTSLAPGGAAVVKRGVRGALLAGPGGLHEAPAPVVEVVDTIGAGDCFNAGYLATIATGGSLPEALAAGVAVASAAISTRPRSYRGAALTWAGRAGGGG